MLKHNGIRARISAMWSIVFSVIPANRRLAVFRRCRGGAMSKLIQNVPEDIAYCEFDCTSFVCGRDGLCGCNNAACYGEPVAHTAGQFVPVSSRAN